MRSRRGYDAIARQARFSGGITGDVSDIRILRTARMGENSIISQRLLLVSPGTYDSIVSVRDEETGTVGRVEQTVTVPRFGRPALPPIFPVFQATGRASP